MQLDFVVETTTAKWCMRPLCTPHFQIFTVKSDQFETSSNTDKSRDPLDHRIIEKTVLGLQSANGICRIKAIL